MQISKNKQTRTNNTTRNVTKYEPKKLILAAFLVTSLSWKSHILQVPYRSSNSHYSHRYEKTDDIISLQFAISLSHSSVPQGTKQDSLTTLQKLSSHFVKTITKHNSTRNCSWHIQFFFFFKLHISNLKICWNLSAHKIQIPTGHRKSSRVKLSYSSHFNLCHCNKYEALSQILFSFFQHFSTQIPSDCWETLWQTLYPVTKICGAKILLNNGNLYMYYSFQEVLCDLLVLWENLWWNVGFPSSNT